MKRLAAILAVVLAGSVCLAQTDDGRLLREARFDSPDQKQAAEADTVSVPGFFRNKMRTQGFFPALFLTTDHITRITRIGSAGRRNNPEILDFSKSDRLPRPAAGSPQSYASTDFEFVEYLIGNNMEADAVTLLTRGRYHASDTLHYLRGWAEYSARYLEDASASFDLVPKDSPFYDKSLFFNVISNAHIGRYSRSAELLRSYDGPYRELKSLEEAGIALLEGRAADYITAANRFTFSQYALTDSERQLQGIYNQRYYGAVKSPALAAAASAVVPGLGKVYAGRLAEGVSSFLAVGSLAAITAENWTRHGLKDWKTILFGTVGTIFYIGNIYGSYLSVSIQNEELKDAQDTAILYHIHIPLRSVFQ